MVDTAVHDFTSKPVLVDTDEFYLVQSPYGVGDDRKVAWADLKVDVASYLNLVLEATDTLAQRRGVNAQVTHGYRTFTDVSNYERWALQSGAGYFELAAETAGTGTDDIDLRVTPSGVGKLVVGGSNKVVGSGGGNSGEIIVQKDADGGGVMIAREGIGNRWLFAGATGHLLAQTDNSFDIGASGANRPRNGFFGGNLAWGTSNTLSCTNRTAFSCPADGVLTLSVNVGGDFDRLQFGGTSASFPALKRSSAALQARLADDTNFADFTAQAITANNNLIWGTSNVLACNNRTAFACPADGILTLSVNAGGDFGRLNFGGTSSSFPALKRSSAVLQVRLADDSLFADLTAANITADTGLRINQAPTAVSSAAVTISSAADGAANIGHRIKINFNGIDYWIPASSVAF